MIKTKIFRTDFDLISGESADEKCNKFIEENKSITPIDFRFSNSVSKNSLIPTICESILLIYKESVEE